MASAAGERRVAACHDALDQAAIGRRLLVEQPLPVFGRLCSLVYGFVLASQLPPFGEGSGPIRPHASSMRGERYGAIRQRAQEPRDPTEWIRVVLEGLLAT